MFILKHTTAELDKFMQIRGRHKPLASLCSRGTVSTANCQNQLSIHCCSVPYTSPAPEKLIGGFGAVPSP